METVQLPVAQRAKNALKVTPEYEKQLVALGAKHKGITAITNEAGLKDCHSARMELKNARLAIEKVGKAAREDAQAFAKAVIAEEKRLVGMVAPEEERLQTLQTGYERQQEALRAAAAKAEQERVAGIQKRIADLERIPVLLVGRPASTLAAALETLRQENPEEWAQEFLPLATMTHRDVLADLEKMHAAAESAEAAVKRQVEESARIEAEIKRIAEAQEKFEADQRAAREKSEAEDRERRRKLDEEEAARRKALREEEDRILAARRVEEEKLAAERRALEDAARRQREAEEAREREERRKQEEAEAAERARQRAEQEAKEEAARKEREAREAAEREARRKEAETLEAEQHLQAFVDRFGHIAKFGWITGKIKHYLREPKKAA